MMLDTNSLISIVILFALIVAVWRGGAANPVGTRAILDTLGKYDARLRNVETKSLEAASNAAVTLLAEQVKSLEAHAASSGEVIEIQGDVKLLRSTVEAKFAGLEKSTDRTEAAVQRIEDYFIGRGINGK